MSIVNSKIEGYVYVAVYLCCGGIFYIGFRIYFVKIREDNPYKMVFCKFYQQGNCRFGSNCKFDHQIPQVLPGGTSILLKNYEPPTSQQVQQQAGGQTIDTNTLVKAVVNDMMSTEKGGQWLLSSYSPFKDKPPFPGFEDYSQEEVRQMFYEAAANKNLDQFKQNLQQMLQQAVMKVRALQNPSLEVINVLKQIYNSPSSSEMSGTSSNNLFGSSPNQPSSSSIFGGNMPSSGQQQQTSIFAGNSMQQQGSNIFATQNSSMFPNASSQIGQQNTNSIFGSMPPVAQNSSFFETANQSRTSIFGPAPPVTSNGASIFATAAPSQQQSSIFGGQPIFQNVPPNTTAPFNNSVLTRSQDNQNLASQQQSIFANPQSSNLNMFQSQSEKTPVPQSNIFQKISVSSANVGSQNLFQQNAGGFGVNQLGSGNFNPDFYSKIEELSEEDLKWFGSNTLDINKIPDVPPSYDMCF